MEQSVGDTERQRPISHSGSVDGSHPQRASSSGSTSDDINERKRRSSHDVVYDGFAIEPVDESNIAYIVQLAQELHGAGTLRTIPFDWAFCLATMRRVVRSPFFYARMARNRESYCGAIVGRVEPCFFSPRLIGFENAWFVRENTPFRAKIAMALMRGYVKWAIEEKGADHVQGGDIANINSVGVDILYRRLGFKRYGSIYRFGGV